DLIEIVFSIILEFLRRCCPLRGTLSQNRMMYSTLKFCKNTVDIFISHDTENSDHLIEIEIVHQCLRECGSTSRIMGCINQNAWIASDKLKTAGRSRERQTFDNHIGAEHFSIGCKQKFDRCKCNSRILGLMVAE